MLPTVKLKPREHHRLVEGHLWVFRNEIQSTSASELAELVRVCSSDAKEIGVGFYHPMSQIAVRLLGTNQDTIGEEFFVQRFERALRHRTLTLPTAEAYRVVFGEADLLSGLIVDRFADTLVLQMHAAGMDVRSNEIVRALLTVMPEVTGIVERNTMSTRVKEGLPLRDGVLWGKVNNTISFTEGSVRLEIDVVGGQKTGYFLDQRVNRLWIAQHAKGRTVLDCFCNVGGFALHAGMGGATEVLGIDSSELAIESARRHAVLNELPQVNFEKANVFDVLRQHAEVGRTWDVVILDPPSFAKNRSALVGARAGYAELNRIALKLLGSGGLLVSASCTQLVAEHELLDIVYREAARLRKTLRLIHRGNQSPDHPVLLAMPETQYLKFLVFEVY